MRATCEAADCLRPTRGGRTYCEAHSKRATRGGVMSAPILEPRTPYERFIDAVLRYADVDSGDEKAFERAKWNLNDAGRRHFAKSLPGPAPLIDTRRAVRLFRQNKSIKATAREMGFSRDAVRRALARGGVRRNVGATPTRVASPPMGED